MPPKISRFSRFDNDKAYAMIEGLKQYLNLESTPKQTKQAINRAQSNLSTGVNRLFNSNDMFLNQSVYNTHIDKAAQNGWRIKMLTDNPEVQHITFGLANGNKSYQIQPFLDENLQNNKASIVIGINPKRFETNPQLASRRVLHRYLTETLNSPQLQNYNRSVIERDLRGPASVTTTPAIIEKVQDPNGFKGQMIDKVVQPERTTTTYAPLPKYSDQEISDIREAALKQVMGYPEDPIANQFDKNSWLSYLTKVLGVGSVPVIATNNDEFADDPIIQHMNQSYKKGGRIHIKKENRGKFTATKKRTGKTTEELTHSKNPLTRKRAIFAQNAKKWNHG